MTDVAKPSFNNSGEGVSDTVVARSSTEVKAAAPRVSTNAVNAYGITVIRGGSVLGSDFITSVFDAYYNFCSYQYIGTALLVISSLFFLHSLANVTGVDDPFTAAEKSLTTTHTNKNSSAFVKALTMMVLLVLKFPLKDKVIAATLIGFSSVYFGKPSYRNGIMAAILSVFCIVTSTPPGETLGLMHMFFLLTQLRNPTHKTIVVLSALVIVLIGHNYLSSMLDIKTDSVVPPNDTGRETRDARTFHTVATPKPKH